MSQRLPITHFVKTGRLVPKSQSLGPVDLSRGTCLSVPSGRRAHLRGPGCAVLVWEMNLRVTPA